MLACLSMGETTNLEQEVKMFARPFIMLCHVAPFCPQFETSVRNTHKLTHTQNRIWFLQLIITLKPNGPDGLGFSVSSGFFGYHHFNYE